MNTFRLRPVLYFILLSYGLAWVVALPLWLDGGLKNRFFTLIGVAMMWTPTLAAVIVIKLTDPAASLPESLGLRPWRPLGRTVLFSLFALLASLLVVLMALVIGSRVGVYRFDLEHFSGLEELMRAQLAGRADQLPKLPVRVLAALATVQVVVAAPVVALFALGEEIGWRGYLLPKLMPLGTVPALIASGLIWALWHAPVILLGYNYGATPGWLALACMSAMCIVVGSVLAWTRLRSGSVWPAALGHGAFNSAAGLVFIFGSAGQKLDMTQATPLGWTGWVFPAVCALILFTVFKTQRGPSPQF
jgi:uncharacterized protein